MNDDRLTNKTDNLIDVIKNKTSRRIGIGKDTILNRTRFRELSGNLTFIGKILNKERQH